LIFPLLFIVGCKTSGKPGSSEIPAVLWERTFPSEDVNEILDWNLLPGIKNNDFGILSFKEEHYSNVGLELQPKKMTVLGNGSNYIIDLEFPVEINSIVKKYGHNIQFQIRIYNGPPPWIDIYTTINLTRAVALKMDDSPIVAELDNDNKVVSVLWDTPEKGLENVKVQISKKSMRIYLPIKIFPESSSNWWPKDKAKRKAHFRCHIFSRLALPPVKPIQSNIKDLFLMPLLYFCECPEHKGSVGIRLQGWVVKVQGKVQGWIKE
jgi:hypothetical protein